MKICAVVYELQPMGGLEEYAVALAIALRQEGHDVKVVSTAWISPANQYMARLRAAGVSVEHPPRLLSQFMSDWPTKDRLVRGATKLLTPVLAALALPLGLMRRQGFAAAFDSVKGRVRGMLSSVIHRDLRAPYTRLALEALRLRWKPDVLHVQGYTSNLLFVNEWARRRGIPAVYEEHQTPDPQFDWWKSFAGSVNQASRVIAVSETSAQALRDVCGITRPIVVRNPLLADPLQGGWKRGASGDPQRIRVTTVARLYVTKGLVYLLDSIAEILEQFPGAEFRVYGDGALREELLAHAAQLGLDGERIFVGAFRHEDLGAIMADTDLFVMPSILEGQPLALVEAMAYGCPIVTTSVGGIPELIQDGENGLLCEPANVDQLTAAMRRMMADPGLRRRLGEAARRSYEQGPYQPAALSKHFGEIYRESIAEACHQPA